ncbi:MAG: HD domain-containing protein [Desulfobulbus sp.]|nr:HD domain-containing protein [Desulfobulbus sp.]
MNIQEKKIFVNELTAGQQLKDLFLVSKKNLADTKTGKPYLAMTLMDRTGEVEARVWENAPQYDALVAEGDVALVQAVAKPFRDQLQMSVTSLQKVDGTVVDMSFFMPVSTRPPAEMTAELSAVIDSIADPALQLLLRNVFQGEVLMKFQRAPAAKKLHHAYIGGLMEHTLSIVGMAEKVAGHYPMIDRDMLIAGALVHDLAKIEEFDFSTPAFQYTDRGRLVGHLVMGVDIVRRAAEQVTTITEEQLDRLLHMILSHHGQYGFGSPVLPMTPEAVVLHHLDDMDAKMQYMEALCGRMAGSGWQWTDYQRHLERYLYLRASGESQEETADQTGEVPPAATFPPSEPARQPREKPSPAHRQRSLF